MQPLLLPPVTMQKAMLQCAIMGESKICEALQVAQLQEQKIHQADLQTDVEL